MGRGRGLEGVGGDQKCLQGHLPPTLSARVSRRRQKLRRIGRDWGLSGVADTPPHLRDDDHEDNDDNHDDYGDDDDNDGDDNDDANDDDNAGDDNDDDNAPMLFQSGGDSGTDCAATLYFASATS